MFNRNLKSCHIETEVIVHGAETSFDGNYPVLQDRRIEANITLTFSINGQRCHRKRFIANFRESDTMSEECLIEKILEYYKSSNNIDIYMCKADIDPDLPTDIEVTVDDNAGLLDWMKSIRNKGKANFLLDDFINLK